MFFPKLLFYRKKYCYTQQYIANYLAIPRTQYYRYETGINEVPIRILIKLKELYKISLDELIQDYR